MKVTTEPLEHHQLSVTIEVDEAQTAQAMRRAARQIAQEARIPGFRRGKAPYDLIVQRFGESTVRREAADLMAEEIVRQALEQEAIDAYASGQLTNVTLDPITYTLTVPLNPRVDLGDYHSIRIEPQAVEVPEEQVQEALQKIREDNTVFESVERPARWDDGLALDLVAVTDDGTQVLKGDGLHVVLEAGSTDPVPGFHEAVVGMSPGEERTFPLTLPADFPQETYRGQEAEFTVSIQDVYDQIIPELDDDLARTVGTFDSLEELKQGIRDQIRRASQAEQDRKYADQVVEAVAKQAVVEFPPPMLEAELDRLYAEVEGTVTRQARLSMDDFLRMRKQTKEQFREGLSDSAAARVAQALVLGEVVRKEALQVSDSEVEAGIQHMSASSGRRAGQVRESLDTEDGRRAMHNRLLADKAVRRLVAIARGEAEEAAAAEPEPNAPAAEPAEAAAVVEAPAEAGESPEDAEQAVLSEPHAHVDDAGTEEAVTDEATSADNREVTENGGPAPAEGTPPE